MDPRVLRLNDLSTLAQHFVRLPCTKNSSAQKNGLSEIIFWCRLAGKCSINNVVILQLHCKIGLIVVLLLRRHTDLARCGLDFWYQADQNGKFMFMLEIIVGHMFFLRHFMIFHAGSEIWELRLCTIPQLLAQGLAVHLGAEAIEDKTYKLPVFLLYSVVQQRPKSLTNAWLNSYKC